MVNTAVGDAGVVRGRGGVLEHVRGGDLCFGDGHRGERHALGVGGVPGCPYVGVRGALQVAGHRDAVLAPVDAGGVQTQIGQLCDPSGAVDHEVALDLFLFASVFHGDLVAIIRGLHVHDRRGAVQADADLPAVVDQEFDEVGIEALQRTLAAVDDDWGAACSGGDVGELEGDESAADEHYPGWQLGEVHEVGAVDEVLVTGEVQRSGAGAGRDQEMIRVVWDAVDLETAVAGERRLAMQGGDATVRQGLLHALGDRVGEAVLVSHQVRPADRELRVVDALAAHQACAVDDLRAATQDLLRVAPPQRARSSIGQ